MIVIRIYIYIYFNLVLIVIISLAQKCIYDIEFFFFFLNELKNVFVDDIHFSKIWIWLYCEIVFGQILLYGIKIFFNWRKLYKYFDINNELNSCIFPNHKWFTFLIIVFGICIWNYSRILIKFWLNLIPQRKIFTNISFLSFFIKINVH